MKLLIISFVILLISNPFIILAGEELSPDSIQGAATIAAGEAKNLFDSGAVFVDVRKNTDWESGRIAGAIHLELKVVLCEHTLGEEVKKDQKVVFYCNGPKCMRSSEATSKAVAWGYSNVYYFRHGFPAWTAIGYPVEQIANSN